MAKTFTIGVKKQKKRKWDLIVGALVIALIFGGFLFLRSENRINTLTIDNSNNAPQTKVIGAVEESSTKVNQDEFRMVLPGKWEEWEEHEYGGHTPGQVYRYKALGVRDNGRYLEVYINSMPKEVEMTHLLPLEIHPNKTELTHGQISDLCRNFADIDKKKIVGVVKARWKGIEFDCDVHRYRNIVGTAVEGQGYGAELKNGQTKNEYFFYYTDHGISANNQIFQDIIRSFETKNL